MAGKSFSLADVAIFPIFAYVFYYWYVDWRILKNDSIPLECMFCFVSFFSPPKYNTVCSARSVRHVTPTWQPTTTVSRTGPASRPPGPPPGSRTLKEWSTLKTVKMAALLQPLHAWLVPVKRFQFVTEFVCIDHIQ